MTKPRETLQVAISKRTHELIRRVAYEHRTTMRHVLEEAAWKVYGAQMATEEDRLTRYDTTLYEGKV